MKSEMKTISVEQLKEELKKLKEDYEVKKTSIIKNYIVQNNPYEVGDVIEDHMGKIRIEKLGYYIGLNDFEYSARYYGIMINKNGKENKKGEKRWVYQSNINGYSLI